MPREIIECGEGKTKVGWATDGGHDVQLGIAIPGIVINEVRYDDVWAHLDRHGVNRLIRTLRRARDATFGADA